MTKQKNKSNSSASKPTDVLYTVTPSDAIKHNNNIDTLSPSNQEKIESSDINLEQSSIKEESPIKSSDPVIQVQDIKTTISDDKNNKTVSETSKKTRFVYEIKHIINKQEHVFYTYDVPELINNTLVLLKPFGRKDLKEVVLGRKEIKAFCKIELKEEAVKIDLLKGVLIRVVEEQPWMSLNQEETQRLFDQKVLAAYRQLSADLINKKTPQSNIFTQEEIYPVGNIPPQYPRIQDF